MTGIVHLALGNGKVSCSQKRRNMLSCISVTTADGFDTEFRKCKKCETKRMQMKTAPKPEGMPLSHIAVYNLLVTGNLTQAKRYAIASKTEGFQ